MLHISTGLIFGGYQPSSSNFPCMSSFLNRLAGGIEVLRGPKYSCSSIERFRGLFTGHRHCSPQSDDILSLSFLGSRFEPLSLNLSNKAQFNETLSALLNAICSNLHRSLPVEKGSSYTDDAWSINLMTIGEFMELCLNEGADYKPYLAQVPLHRHLNISIPLFELLPSEMGEFITYFWVGPAGTLSPFHTDALDNIFFQICGTKKIVLVPPEASQVLKPKKGVSYSLRAYFNFSQVLTNTTDLKFDDLEDQKCLERNGFKPLEFVLNAGDILFIPRNWWHMVESLSPSISMSNWFG